MGLVYAEITLQNARDVTLIPLQTTCLVDTGAYNLCIPEHVAMQLKLTKLEDREIELADGKKMLCPFVGPIIIKFENRQSFCGAMVVGNEVLLGAIPMEDMDVVVHPRTQRLIVNPQNPNFTCHKVK